MTDSHAVNILIVDDRPENLLAMEAVLRDQQYNLVRASSGEEALRQLLLGDFAAIILDVQMPGLNGFETAKMIKTREKTKHIPIIFVTAINQDAEHVMSGYAVGAIDYMFKPFEPETLKAKIDGLVSIFKNSQQLKLQKKLLTESKQELEKANQELLSLSKQIRRAENFARGRVFELIAKGEPLEKVLHELIVCAEAYFENSAGIIMFRQLQQTILIAPSISNTVREYLQCRINEDVLPKSVLIPEAAELTEEESRSFLNHGFRMRWSIPVVSADAENIGQFSLYVREAKKPNDDQLAFMETLSYLISIALERKQSERTLKENEEQYRLLFEGNPNPMWVYDAAALQMLAVNEAAVKHYGYTTEEFLDLTSADLEIHDESLIPGLMKHMKKSGEQIYVEKRSQSLVFKGKNAIVSLINDVTKRVEAEAKLAVARDAALKASRVKSEFLANMSHEIRTPLHAIIGATNLLAETVLNKEQQAYVKISENAGISLLNLVNDILDFSKIEAGQIVIDASSFSLGTLLEQTLNILQIAADKKGISLKYKIDSSVPTSVVGDATKLQQILLNIVGNAIKFTEAGEVSIHVAKKSDREGIYLFEVMDSGIGIPLEKQNDIFDVFTQVDSSSSKKFGGSGLGLSISKKLLEAMGGSIGVTSTVGKGSIFFFTVSLSSGVDSMTSVEPVFEIGNHEAKILIVDDSEDNRLLIEAFLKTSPYQTETAENGREALEKFQCGSYDLILMDMQMPVMDGYSATKAIRDLEVEKGCESVPIIALTAYVQLKDKQKCMESGCTSFVSKPIRKLELLKEISKYLDK